MKTLLTVSLLLVAASSFAQYVSESRLASGTTSSNGTAAPTGTQWSEVQTPAGGGASNGTLGYSLNYLATGSTAPYRQGDDFTVPAGQTWNVGSMTLYGFFSGATPTSQFTSGVLRIWNARPDAPGAQIVAGDLTTNRVTATSFTGLYRIGRGAPGTTRPILAATMSLNATLGPGTYWFEYGLYAGTTSVFAPLVTVPGVTAIPDANSFFYTSQTYYAATDTNSGVALALPFSVNPVPEPTAVAVLGLGLAATRRRRR